MFLTAFAAALISCAGPAPLPDNLWLEDIEGAKPMEWVKAENAKTIPVLQGDARYQKLHDEAFSILSATDRIPAPTFIGEAVFNFWQDADHVRGVWRRATLASYRTGKPQWETVIDVDALAKAEKANWIWKGADCRAPAYDRCLIELSNGGKDAVEIREFDLKTKSFVAGGFKLSESKQTVAWLDPDTLIMTRDWGPGTTTDSGYGMVVKTLKRGQPLDEAVEVYRGQKSDVSVRPNVIRDAKGNRVVLIEQAVDFLRGDAEPPVPADLAPEPPITGAALDLADVRGHNGLIPALEVAAAGGHNLYLYGPPGTGKTMLARRLPSILPPMTASEAIEVTRISSVGGVHHGGGLATERPFRAPHHTISSSGLVGGGAQPTPGEATLAHHGKRLAIQKPSAMKPISESELTMLSPE